MKSGKSRYYSPKRSRSRKVDEEDDHSVSTEDETSIQERLRRRQHGKGGHTKSRSHDDLISSYTEGSSGAGKYLSSTDVKRRIPDRRKPSETGISAGGGTSRTAGSIVTEDLDARMSASYSNYTSRIINRLDDCTSTVWKTEQTTEIQSKLKPLFEHLLSNNKTIQQTINAQEQFVNYLEDETRKL
eukprot:UN24266